MPDTVGKAGDRQRSRPGHPTGGTAFRELEQLLQASLEATGDGILVVDREGRIILSNRRFAEMWRIPDSLIRQKDDIKLRDSVMGQLVDPEAYLEKTNELYGRRDESTDILTREIRDEIKKGEGIFPKGAPKLGSYFVPFCIPWVDTIFSLVSVSEIKLCVTDLPPPADPGNR